MASMLSNATKMSIARRMGCLVVCHAIDASASNHLVKKILVYSAIAMIFTHKSGVDGRDKFHYFPFEVLHC
jgi:hypothetical protein